ncbi:centrosomal protein of 135 kDa-like isoform X2 [Nerophis ophidion]|uniref:centrosomal protein of 135 kDa-like isoform X2 n=1 Tax=Nerophis ophidion TaxID=159077 RepID=UPI002ADFC7F0|nr:centrosomal protein of 135 kDa-like isoform X2 [Nerophis ophidion]
MESSIEKFVSLRKRLDQLGYKHPLGIESLPLVEKLFSDLVRTTESLRNAKLLQEKNEEDCLNCDVLLEPYMADNARLVKENNEVYQELLKVKEEKDHATKELKTRIRKLEYHICDLTSLNNQYMHKLRSLEKDCKTKAERILELEEKNLQAVVQTPGGKKRSIPFWRPRMQTDELIPPPATSAYPVPQPDDPYTADLLQLADKRILELEEEVTKIHYALDDSHECLQLLNTQVSERDREIERLNRSLHGGRPRDVISLEAQNIRNEKRIAQLNLQIDFLLDNNRALQQMVESLQPNRMEMDKERALEMADQELLDTKETICRQSDVIENFEDNFKKISAEHSERGFETSSLADQLVELRGQNEKLEAKVDFIEREKVRLQDKVEKMFSTERDIVLELEAMRAKHGICERDRTPSRYDAFVKSLEEERDRYRQEAEHCRRFRGGGSPSRGSPDRIRSPGRRVIRERDEIKAALVDVEKHAKDIHTKVKAIRAERDHFKMMFYQAQEKLEDARVSSSTSDDVLTLREELKLAENEIMQVNTQRELLMEDFKVEGELIDVQTAAEPPKKQLGRKRQIVCALNTLLSTTPQRELQTNLATSEKDSKQKA